MRDKAVDETLDEPALGTADRQHFGERFVAEELVGSGGMGMVLRGRDLLDGSRVALKVLHRKEGLAVERFAREAEMLAGLLHPAIVRYVAHGQTVRGEPYLAMEWLDGESLADRLERESLEPSAVARLGARILRALAVAHAQDIVHRDIKPSNLFLVNGDLEQAKLLDFGIAQKADGDWHVTRPGGAPGTRLYMAPEQSGASESGQVDGRADIFSLGCVLHECISREAPIWRMAEGRPAWDQEALAEQRQLVPEPLRTVLDGMTALAPESRPAAADKLADELTAVAERLAEGRAAPVSRSRQTLSSEERRSAVVLFVDSRTEGSLPTEGNDLGRDVLREALAEAGAKLVLSADAQGVMATFPTSAIPADQAARAARVALRLRKKLPSVGLTIGMNPELPSVGLPSEGANGGVRIDAATARLLEGRFELQHLTEGSFELLFEKGVGEVPRTLMGKELPCFGRQRELRLLEGLWQEVCETPVARAMVVVAPAGGGKSRVRHQFCEAIRAEGQPFELLIGRGDPMRDGAPFALLGPALLSAAEISGNGPEAAAREKFAAYATRLLPESDRARTVAFLGEIASLPFPDDDLPALRGARKDPRAMADQKLMAWLAWLEAVNAQRPVLIVLEDLHWGDAPSVQFVDAALRVLAEKSLLVLAIARPEVDRRFPNLWQGRCPLRLDLPPLSPRWSRRLVEHVVKLSDERAAWIIDRAQGNPFFLQELLRMDAEGRSLCDGEIPETVLGAVQARLDTFGPDAKLVLRAASVFGQTFRPDGVRALLDRGRRQDVEHWLGILEKKEIVYAAGEHDEYMFRHALLREAAYDLLPAEERRLGHQLAGQYLEHAGQRDGTVLADHFERGGDPARAIHWLTVAAEQALAANDLLEAISRVERAMCLGASGEERCTLRLIESLARCWRGEYREAEEAAREATQTKETKRKLEATTALLCALGPQAKYEEIASFYSVLLRRPDAPELLNTWLACLFSAGVYLAAGWTPRYYDEILAYLQDSQDNLEPKLIGHMESLRGHIAWDRGNDTAALDGYRQAEIVFRQAGLELDATTALANRAAFLISLGQLEDAESCMRSLLAFARRMDLNHLIGGGLANLAEVLARRGVLDEARLVGQEAIRVTRAREDRRFLGTAETYLAMTEYLACDYALAEHYARSAMDTLDVVPSSRPFAVALLARALCAQGRRDEALRLAWDADEQLRKLGSVSDGEATIRLALAECLLATDDRQAAEQAIQSAAEWLLAAAQKLDVPAHRESFLTRIAENRQILELARQIGIPTA